jgi:hypothetical protein
MVNLFVPELRPPRLDYLPPGAEGIGPGEKHDRAGILLKYLEQGQLKLDGTERFRGADLYALQGLESPEYEGTGRFLFDPNRGYLQVRTVATSSRQKTEFVIMDAKEVMPGAWFPMLVYDTFEGPGIDDVIVKEFRVTKFDARPPAESEFQVKLPAGTWLTDRRSAVTAFKLEKDEVVGLADLPRLLERGAQAKENRLSEQAESGKKGFGPGIWTIVLLALAGALVVFAIVVRYSRRRKARASIS